jgi:hypothetical protein
MLITIPKHTMFYRFEYKEELINEFLLSEKQNF